MLIKDKELLKDIKNGDATVEQISHHLLRHFSMYEIADELSMAYIEANQPQPEVPKIRITKEQFDAFVSVKGYKDYVNDNSIRTEKRGRPRKDLVQHPDEFFVSKSVNAQSK